MEQLSNLRTVKVSEKGQIAIPKAIRQAINIMYGDELVIVCSEDKILLQKSEKISKQLKDDFDDISAITQDSLNEVWDNNEDEIWNEYLK